MSSRLEKLLVALLLQITVAGGFFVAERYVSAHAMAPPAWLATPIDARLPLLPGAVWFYISWYPAPLALLCTERRKFRHGALAMFAAFALCMIGYALIPVSIARPTLDHIAGVSGNVLRRVYAIDAPVNLFPSFHAAAAMVVVLIFFDLGKARYALLLWLLGVGASCVLIKQHYVFDVIAGVLVGWISYNLAAGFALISNTARVIAAGRRSVHGVPSSVNEVMTSPTD